MNSLKETLRRTLQSHRAALDAATVSFAERSVASRLRQFPPYRRAQVLLAYLALGNELPTALLISNAWRDGKRVFVPSAGEFWFVEYCPEARLERGPGGALEPLQGAPLSLDARSGLVLVPVVGWSAGGRRLGRGGGWYDRVLPRLTLPTIGVAYDCQQRDRIPIEPWDASLDYIVTESRLIECGGVLSGARFS